MRKKLQGFTLVELLAAMAIIAILIGLAGFGITIALRNSRDTQRKSALNNMQLVINDYYTRQSAYPASATKGTSTASLVFKDGSGTAVGDAVPLKGGTIIAASTSSSGTLYKYGVPATGGGYYLCAKLESNDWFDLSSSGLTDCSTNAAAVSVAP